MSNIKPSKNSAISSWTEGGGRAPLLSMPSAFKKTEEDVSHRNSKLA